jgi:hypothetical protein
MIGTADEVADKWDHSVLGNGEPANTFNFLPNGIFGSYDSLQSELADKPTLQEIGIFVW